MGLALFYGGLIQLIAGILEFRQGNNFYGLMFCSYAGYFLGLASLYVTGSFTFFSTVSVGSASQTQISDFTLIEKSLGIFYLGWTNLYIMSVHCSSSNKCYVNTVFILFNGNICIMDSCKISYNKLCITNCWWSYWNIHSLSCLD